MSEDRKADQDATVDQDTTADQDATADQDGAADQEAAGDQSDAAENVDAAEADPAGGETTSAESHADTAVDETLNRLIPNYAVEYDFCRDGGDCGQ